MREDSQAGPTHPPPMNFDPARVLRASRLRIGRVRATGVPAILIGVAGIIIAAGIARTLDVIAPNLPETLRETKNLLESRTAARTLKS